MNTKLIEIKNRFIDETIFSAECANIRACLEMAVEAGVDLSYANLDGANLDGASLDGASLNGASLDGASLDGASLNGASLNGASLNRTSLYGASLPEIKKIDNLFVQILALINNGGRLEMDSWHTCETVHCIAGWAVVLAGDAGRVAENLLGTSAAGALIINESCPYLKGKVPDFNANNRDGMKFIEECAAKEKELLSNKD